MIPGLIISIAIIILFGVCFYVAKSMLEIKKFIKVAESENVKTSFEFNSFYDYIYNKYSEELNKINSMISIKIWGLPIIFVLYIIIRVVISKYGNTLFNNDIYSTIYMFIPEMIFFASLIIFTFEDKKQKRAYKEFKVKILNEFIKQINEDYIYVPDKIRDFGMKELYDKSNLDKKYESLVQKDYIEGYLESGTFLKMCFLDVVNSKLERVEYFRGLFAVLMIKNQIDVDMKIVSNGTRVFEESGRVETDSAIFEQYFDVYEDSRFKTFKFLTPEIMNILVKFYEEFKLRFEISIKKDTIYIRFFSGDIFGNAVKETFLSRKNLYMCYSILKLIMDITKEIDKFALDTEINDI